MQLFMMQEVKLKSPPELMYRGKLYSPKYFADTRFSGMRPFLCYINSESGILNLEGQGNREDFICFAEIGR